MIYVDKVRNYPHSNLSPRSWCHLFTDGDVADLHAMAAQLGLDHTWFLNNPRIPYYDCIPEKRTLALRLGAEEISTELLFAMLYPPYIEE